MAYAMDSRTVECWVLHAEQESVVSMAVLKEIDMVGLRDDWTVA